MSHKHSTMYMCVIAAVQCYLVTYHKPYTKPGGPTSTLSKGQPNWQSGQKKWTKKVYIFCFLSVFCKLYIIELSVGPTKCSEQLNTYCKHKIYFIGPLQYIYKISKFSLQIFFFPKRKNSKKVLDILV